MTPTRTQVGSELLEGAPPTMDKSAFIQLLAEQRFEDALTVLMQLRGHSPENASVSRGIQHLKEKVLDGYLVRLGDLDRVPTRAAPSRRLAAEEALLARLVDGTSTLGDILQSSTLGRLVTARLLSQLMEEGVLTHADGRPHLRLVEPGTEPTPLAPPLDFEQALTTASDLCLARRFDEALALYERCALLQPEHPRVRHNLEQLRRRLRT